MTAARLDDVRVQRSLHEEARVFDSLRGVFEDANEELTDRLALLLRIDDPGKPFEEAICGAHMNELDALVPAERLDHLVAFALTHESGVDEDACELMSNGLVHERGCDCGIDATRQA